MKLGEYPPAAFYFQVIFAGSKSSDTSFQEVSGISSEVELEPYVEGGENRFVHQFPKNVKHPLLSLKRGLAGVDSPLVKWCQAIFEKDFIKRIKPKDVEVHLLNVEDTPIMGQDKPKIKEQNPVRVWSFVNAYPVKWEIEAFNSTKNEVAIEKIELCYNYSTRIK